MVFTDCIVTCKLGELVTHIRQKWNTMVHT